uniref:Uncharacterized protein n=1 Tax=Oryza meridionalis TaxID=40149 RepID=A0A0E0CKQ6_9ORYZ
MLQAAKNPSRPRLHPFPLTSPPPELAGGRQLHNGCSAQPPSGTTMVSCGARDGARAVRRWRRHEGRKEAVATARWPCGGGGLEARPARWQQSGGFGEATVGLGGGVSVLAVGSSFLWLARRPLCSGNFSPSLWGASRHGGGVGQPTGKTQVAKARLFPVRFHRSDSTWRPTGGMAEAAWVSVLGRGGGVEGAGGWVVFLAIDQANLCLGSSSPSLLDSTGKPAGDVAEAAWVNALVEAIGAVAVLSLARLEAGRRWGVGWVWRKPCAADV